MAFTLDDWIDERRVLIDDSILVRGDRYTSTTGEAKPAPPPIYSTMLVDDFGRRYERERFGLRVEMIWGSRATWR